MSLWGSFKSFAEKLGAELQKLFGKAGMEQVVQGVITYVAPILETITQLAGGSGAEAIVANIIKAVQADLATVSALVQGGTVAAGSTTAAAITTALNSVKTNLSSLLQDASIKNSGKVSAITTAANLIISEVEALLGQITSSPATTAQPVAQKS